MSLSPAGTITGTPTQTGTYTFTATATDSEQPTRGVGQRTVTITIAPRQLTITTAALPSGKVAAVYSQTLPAAMGIAPLVWTIASGQPPAGLALNAATGVISGTPTQTGTSSFTVKVTDATKPTADERDTASFSDHGQPECPGGGVRDRGRLQRRAVLPARLVGQREADDVDHG